MRVERSRVLVAMLLACLAPAGCAKALDKAAVPPAATSKVKVATLKLPTGKETFLVAASKVDNGLFFTRPPYDMNGSWRTEATCGIFRPQDLVPASGTVFGLEADLRGATPTPTPTQFYGLYAKYFQTPSVGLQVFAASHVFTNGSIGQHFFTNAISVDLAIQTNGTTVTYLARDTAAGGAYTTIGTTPLATPTGAHQPGIGFFQAAKGSTIEFTNFRVPANDPLPVTATPEQQALGDLYRAAFAVLDASYLVDGPVVAAGDATSAAAQLDAAGQHLVSLRTRIEFLSAPTALQKKQALAALTKSDKAVARAAAALRKKGAKAAAAFVKTATGALFTSAWKITDALIPDALRNSLPGGGLNR